MSYTVAALLAVLGTLLLDLVVLRTRVLIGKAFWVSYAIVVFFQLVTNGVLTGREVVVYNPDVIVGLRIVFAPIEDLLFGFAIVVQTLSWWTFWGAQLGRAPQPAASPAPDAPG